MSGSPGATGRRSDLRARTTCATSGGHRVPERFTGGTPSPETPPGPDLGIWVKNLDGGGVQTVCVRLAGALAARGYRIELVVAEAGGVLADQVPPEVPVVAIPPSSRLRSAVAAVAACPGEAPTLLRATWYAETEENAVRRLPGLARYLRHRRPRVLLAATPYRNLEALLARRLAATPTAVFVSEHNDLRCGNSLGTGRHRAILPRLQRRLYPQADGIVAVSRGVADDVAGRAGVPRHRIAVIHNPAVPAEVARLAARPVGHPWLRPGKPPVVLSVGRFGRGKDIPTLLRAFARLRARRPARLVLLGKDRDGRVAALRLLAGELGIAEDVDFPGYSADPFAWMARASLVAVSSRCEGFCNVIAEALACGCPVVSTDCPSGPAEILDGGRFGRLVPVGDDEALAEALATALDGPRDADALRRRASLFTVERAADAYERLLLRGRAPARRGCPFPAGGDLARAEPGY